MMGALSEGWLIVLNEIERGKFFNLLGMVDIWQMINSIWLKLLFAIVAASLIASWFVAGQLVSPASSVVLMPETNMPLEKVVIKSRLGAVLAGWHINAQNDKGVILLFHGIRGTRLSMFQRAKFLFNHGYSVLLVDFQSHGESSGKKMTIGYLEKYDVLASIEYAKSRHQNQPLGVIGVSLGGAAALLATPKNVDALVVESVYSNIQNAVHNRVKARLGFFSWLPAEILLAQLKPRLGFDVSELSPIESVGALNVPILIISGADDKYSTAEESRGIFMQANNPKQLWLVEGVKHEDIYVARPSIYEEKIISFFAHNMRPN